MHVAVAYRMRGMMVGGGREWSEMVSRLMGINCEGEKQQLLSVLVRRQKKGSSQLR